MTCCTVNGMLSFTEIKIINVLIISCNKIISVDCGGGVNNYHCWLQKMLNRIKNPQQSVINLIALLCIKILQSNFTEFQGFRDSKFIYLSRSL